MMAKRIDYIDGMKGLAAVSVFLWHFSLSTGHLYWSYDELLANPVIKFLIDGGLAVCIFILLSGFSNSLAIARKPATIETVKTTLVKRYLRMAVPIAPILVAVFVMRCCGLMTNGEFAQWASWKQAVHCYNDDTMNFLLPFRLIKAILFSPLGDSTGVELPIWMLKYILWGSYFILILHIITNKMKDMGKLAVSIFMFFLCGYMLSAYYYPMIAGYMFYSFYPVIQRSKFKYVFSAISLALALICYFFISQIPFPLNVAITAILIFGGVITNPLLQKILSIEIFKKLGRISFMLYLVHMPIICSLSHFLYIHIPIANMRILSLIVLLITTVTVIVFAHMATVWIEEKWSKKIIDKVLARI